jgi:hypothetical protein
MIRFRNIALVSVTLLLSLALSTPALAQTVTGPITGTATGTVRGVIKDPSGALVPQADITLSSNGVIARKVKSSSAGAYEIPRLAPGRYTLSVVARGFSPALVNDVMVFADKPATQDVQLEISVESSVQVDTDAPGVSVSPDDNANSIVIKGKDLDALSDDPDDLQNELTALAGPSAGPSGGEIYIDGFSGGQLPPKSAIREIRVNRNPFSAQYDKLGYGRIEILTKPGTDKFHGTLMVNGNDNTFNSLNPFVTSEPAYYSTFFTGNASGALTKRASWFGNVFRRDNASNSIVNAEVLDANGNTVAYKIAQPNPQSRLDISPRFDFQLGATNTLSVRYMFDRQIATNSGVSGFSLPSQAYNTHNIENTVQISDTQILSPKVVNDLRFQFATDRDNQTPTTSASTSLPSGFTCNNYNLSTDPTVTVQGAVTCGGNNSGIVKDNIDRYELQDYVTAAHGKHALNFGTRLRLTHEVNTSTAGANGDYIYSSLAAYSAGTPSEYDVTVNTKPTVRLNLFDAAFFYQDDWTAKPNLTLSYGIRYEGQNRIGDHSDIAPRFALSWAPGATNGKKANTVIRAGYGWFYDRFAATNVLNAIRQNGVNQQKYVVENPTFNSNAPAPSTLASLSTSAPTIYSISPNLKASVNMEAAVGVDHSFGKLLTLSATYINSRGVHQYLSDNINAYEAGTYNGVTGTRPNGINENLYQFQSGGVYNQNQLMLNYTVRMKRTSLFGFYQLGFAKSDTSGATYFPSQQTNPGADYGRASFDVRNRFLLGGSVQAPFGISLSPFLVANAGNPFNITTGSDLNGDNQYNDRPSYATASSTDIMKTSLGAFDLDPSSTATRIPYDLGTGPSNWSLNLRISKSIGIGPRVEGGVGGSQGGGPGGGPGGPGGGPGGGGPGGGGGLGPGGLSGNGGPPRHDQQVPRRYALNFAVMAHNALNHTSLATPNGVLTSPNFDKSTAIAGGFFGSAASNRSIDLQISFSF